MDSSLPGVAFDLDGTLFDSRSVSPVAIKNGFMQFQKITGRAVDFPSWEKIKKLIGLPSYEFFPSLLPEEDRHHWRTLHKCIYEAEREQLRQGRGLTFEGVHEVLSELKKEGHFLGCLSNASSDYFNAVLDGCNLRMYFDALEYLGESPFKTKSMVLKDWGKRFGPNHRLFYVGDRAGDIISAHDAGWMAIAVSYGYGLREELGDAEVIIDQISDILKIVKG